MPIITVRRTWPNKYRPDLENLFHSTFNISEAGGTNVDLIRGGEIESKEVEQNSRLEQDPHVLVLQYIS